MKKTLIKLQFGRDMEGQGYYAIGEFLSTKAEEGVLGVKNPLKLTSILMLQQSGDIKKYLRRDCFAEDTPELLNEYIAKGRFRISKRMSELVVEVDELLCRLDTYEDIKFRHEIMTRLMEELETLDNLTETPYIAGFDLVTFYIEGDYTEEKEASIIEAVNLFINQKPHLHLVKLSAASIDTNLSVSTIN